MRDTSLEAYNAVKACGFVDKTKWEVYDCLYKHGPMTQNEVWEKLGSPNKKDSYGPRFAVLVRMGIVAELGLSRCSVTGRKCQFYDVTSAFPVKPEPAEKRITVWVALVDDTCGYASLHRDEAVDLARQDGFSDAVLLRCTGRVVEPE